MNEHYEYYICRSILSKKLKLIKLIDHVLSLINQIIVCLLIFLLQLNVKYNYHVDHLKERKFNSKSCVTFLLKFVYIYVLSNTTLSILIPIKKLHGL